MWYEIGESAAVLDTNDSATFRTVAGRLKSTGQWSALGPPNAAGTYTNVVTLAEDATYIYMGGNFLNFDNISAADYIVRYNKQTGVYSAMGTGANNDVLAIVVMPNGDVIAGGVFTSMGGVANTSRIARWDGSTWNALTTGTNGTVEALTVGFDGSLYVGGQFLLAGGVANTVRIAKWSGTAWTALSTGMNLTVSALAIGTDGTLYAGGVFDTAGGVTVNKMTYWNGTTWVSMAGGFNGVGDAIAAIAVDSVGNIYAAGVFSDAAGIAANNIAYWNGTTWFPLGDGTAGVTPTILAMAIAPDNTVYIGGSFTSAGGLTLGDNTARWNGYAWGYLDIDLPGSSSVRGFLVSKFADPVIEQKYDLYIGFDTSGTGSFAGKVTASNGGSALAFPKIVYDRSGGTTAIIETLKNETIGLEILFNYSLLSGETLTVDLNPLNRTVISSFFGPRFDAVLPNSDFGIWALQPGNQDLTSFVATSGSPTITAFLLWRDCFKSYD